MKKIKLFIFAVLVTTIANGQAPQKMSYQAVIRDVSQTLVINQLVGMQISILQGSATGSAVYVETQQPTSNINGLVSIEIGVGTIIFGNFSTIDWSNGPYFIKTETDPTGGSTYTITGTSQLLSVPYALYAENSGSSIPGPQGPQGLIGLTGATGSAGADGVDGATGPQGPIGLTGATGLTGTTGPQGLTGATGATGSQGLPGTNGIDGISINWLGSLTSAPGSPSLNDGYYNTTLLQSFIWDGASWQIIAKDGATGPQGLIGLTGATGATGPQGPAGADGSLNAWSLTGNAGTTPSINFVGTNDNVDVIFKRYGAMAGRLGSLNTAFGLYALNNSTGNYNTGIGTSALVNNSTGYANVAVGGGSLANNTIGNLNSSLGWNALMSNTSGLSNSAFGSQSLYYNTTGSGNSVVGLGALYYNTTGSSNSGLGYRNLHYNTTGAGNTAIGYHSLYNNTTGNSNTALGISAGYLITTGSNNIIIGTNAQVPSATSDNQVRIGDINITYAGIQVAWSITSDKRWKADIMPSNLGLDFIKKLNPVFYTRNNDKSKKTEYGFIAQELEATLNNAGAKNNGIITIDDEGMYSVRYNDLIAPMVKAMQEQQKMIEQQQVLILKMQKEIDLLKK